MAGRDDVRGAVHSGQLGDYSGQNARLGTIDPHQRAVWKRYCVLGGKAKIRFMGPDQPPERADDGYEARDEYCAQCLETDVLDLPAKFTFLRPYALLRIVGLSRQ